MTQPLTLSARCAATLFIVGFLMATITDAAEIRLRDGVHPNSYLCPADLGYGCCQNGLACGKSQCYATEPQTYVFTKTATTTEDGGAAKTLTSTITTTVTPTGDSEPTGAFPPETQFAKYYPSAIDKEQPIVTNTEDKDDGGGGGLTGAQIGGAVGGAVALLAIILVAAFLVIRRLNHVAKVVQEGGASVSGGSGSTADTSDYFKRRILAPYAAPKRLVYHVGAGLAVRAALGRRGSSGFSSRRQSHRSNSESTAAGSSTPGTWTRSNSTSVSRSGSSGRRTSGFGDATGVSSDNEGEEIAELEAGERALDMVSEAGEFHGYYGPADKLMGQTAARQVAAADKAARPVSSPPAMAGASDPAPGADGREES
ncbi:unnamed protein product [Parascedosporium putredinis]|uniref:Uncharacterized protein n=1 Tax=Parascedosporium putredinis TaxID=1442378 RepID=A0A9P1H5X9_9PEZI|nr:unnamed protein product [Parascedosporium putredinis]CAI7999764.1 unnamed protein product [Parascedosporium putredinis]